MTYSDYVIDVNIYDKHNNLLFNIYDEDCLVLIDETILNLLKKIAYKYNLINENKIDHTMLYIYNESYYNLINDCNIRSSNILNEIVEDYNLMSNKLNINNMIIDHFGLVKKIKLNILIISNELDNILNFYSTTINEKVISLLFKKTLMYYFPLLNIYTLNNIIQKNVSLDISTNISRFQYEILELESVDKTDLNYLGDTDLSSLFLIIYPEFKCNFNFDMLKNNILFLNDIFLHIFNYVKISKEILSIILLTPQIILQKGFIEKEIKKINNYKIIIKSIFKNIKITFEFELNKCKMFINFSDYKFKKLNNLSLETIIKNILNIISNDFIQISYSKYNIDFFNVKTPLIKEINISSIVNRVKHFTEYFFISKENDKSLLMKYKIGYIYNTSNLLYNKLYSIMSKGDITYEEIYKIKVEYGIDNEEINSLINDIKIKINTSSYKESGISISITKSYVIVSGIVNIDICNRIIYLINKVFNLSLNKELSIDKKVLKTKSNDEYMKYITLFDTYLSNKENAYWCKACQNYGNKIRKPILYDHIPSSYTYDSLTNTYINSNGYRIIKISDDVYFGCNESKKNLNKYIGFIKSCSLCCFKIDQFKSKSLVIRKKVKNCWNKNIDILKNDINYVYSYSRIIGDISKMLYEFEDYFENNYLCKLEYIGHLNIKPHINTLIFIDNILINPQMYTKLKKYKIFIYQNPFLHKVIDQTTYSDEFESTPIDKFINNANNIFNIVNPTNSYLFYFNNKHLIKSFSFIENTFIIIFIFINGLVFYINDKSLKFGEYQEMFDDIKYVNKFDIPSFDIITLNATTKKTILDNLEITNILINTENKINGFIISNNIYIIFKELIETEFNIITNKKYIHLEKIINIDIINYISNSIKSIQIESIVESSIYEEYYYTLFKYNFFIFLNINKNIRESLLKIIETNESIHVRYNEIKKFIFKLFSDDNLFIKIVDNINYTFSIHNDINVDNSYSNTCSDLTTEIVQNKKSNCEKICKYPYENDNNACKLLITRPLLDKLLSFLVNELIYNFSSIYIYISKYIDNTFSYSNNYVKIENINYNDYTLYTGKIIGDQFIQEIYNKNLQIYRALANIYFWVKMKAETNMTRKNLGYISKSQTNLANYLKSNLIFEGDKNTVNIVEEFNNKYKLNVSLLFDNDISNKISTYNIYLNIKNNTIKNISVGFLI